MISIQLCSLWQRITASCHPDLESDRMTEGLHPQHSVPSRMACRCIGVSKKTHHRLQQIEVDIGAQLRPGQWIVALKII